MSRACATLAGAPLRNRGDSRFAGTTQYCWLSQIRPKGTQRPRLPVETIGRPIGEAAAGPDRPVPTTCVNAHNARVGKGCVLTWLETPGEFCAPVSRAAPSGAIPSERSLGGDVAAWATLTKLIRRRSSNPCPTPSPVTDQHRHCIFHLMTTWPSGTTVHPTALPGRHQDLRRYPPPRTPRPRSDSGTGRFK
jgi:hypothetical protein